MPTGAGLSVVLEYLTEDGLFSIDIALRPPPAKRKQPAPEADVQSAPDAQPSAEVAAGTSPADDRPDESVSAAAGEDGHSDTSGSLSSSEQISEAGTSTADSAAAGDAGQSGVGEARKPAAGGLLMLQPGFRLKGPLRWRPSTGGSPRRQPSEEFRVSRLPANEQP